MEENLKQKIDAYIVDYHNDEESQKYAFAIGKLVFAFLDYLNDQNISERTFRKHRSNLQLIALFEFRNSYGYNPEFYPEIWKTGPRYVDEFERKVSDTDYALESYSSTWRKLNEFIKSKAYINYLARIEKALKTP